MINVITIEMNNPALFGLCARHAIEGNWDNQFKNMLLMKHAESFLFEVDVVDVLNKIKELDDETFGKIAYIFASTEQGEILQHSNNIHNSANTPNTDTINTRNYSETEYDKNLSKSGRISMDGNSDSSKSKTTNSGNNRNYQENDKNHSRSGRRSMDGNFSESSRSSIKEDIKYPSKRLRREPEVDSYKRQKTQLNTMDNWEEPKIEIKAVNFPRSFDDGRPCCRCNNLAAYFNKKGIKISLPNQHAYGRCPLYCNICSDKFRCHMPEEHLMYKCVKCDTTYSNHPTDRCHRK